MNEAQKAKALRLNTRSREAINIEIARLKSVARTSGSPQNVSTTWRRINQLQARHNDLFREAQKLLPRRTA